MPTKIKKPHPNTNLLHPRHWLTWLGVSLLWLLTRLPLKVQLLVGRWLGRASYYLAKHRRHISEVNLKLCFPELSEKEHKALVKKTLISNICGFIEAQFGWWSKPERLRPLVETEGFEHLQAAKEQGRGVIILGMHLTTLDLAGCLFNLFADADVIYRKQKNPVFEYLIKKGRSKHFKYIIDRADTRRIFKNLKQGRMIWYAPDQDYGRKASVFAPFFGIPAASITATARLAKLNNSPIVVFTHYRKEDNSGYRLKISKPIENFPSGDDVEDATRINQIIENAIRVRPEQYMWTHRRFKTRPEGEKSLY